MVRRQPLLTAKSIEAKSLSGRVPQAMVKRSVTELGRIVEGTGWYWEPTGPFDWSDVFSERGPVEIDVGCGKGLFLSRAAERAPERNFLGIEISRRYALIAARRLLVAAICNAKVAKADARAMFQSWLPASSVAVVHVYYPDPWWKRRHKKRRLFNEQFLQSVVRVLEPAGQLRIATDVAEYFEVIKELVARSGQFGPSEPLPRDELKDDLDCLSNFDRKYRKEGRHTYSRLFRRLDTPNRER